MACAALVLLLITPFNVTVAPEWNINVIDENDRPITGAYVSEFADQWTLDVHRELSVCTDLYGAAHFPRQQARASLATRVLRFIATMRPHSSRGLKVVVNAEGLGYGDMQADKNSEPWYGNPDRMTSRLTLHKCAEGHTGYRCFFDYDYFFRVNSAARQMEECLRSPGRQFANP